MARLERGQADGSGRDPWWGWRNKWDGKRLQSGGGRRRYGCTAAASRPPPAVWSVVVLHAVKQSIHHFIRSGPFTSSAARTAASPAVPLSWRHWSHALAPLGLGGSPARPDCRPSSQPNTAPLWPWLSQHAAGGVFIPCAVLSPLLSWQAWRYLSAERAPRPPRLRPPHRRLLLRARCRRA